MSAPRTFGSGTGGIETFARELARADRVGRRQSQAERYPDQVAAAPHERGGDAGRGHTGQRTCAEQKCTLLRTETRRNEEGNGAHELDHALDRPYLGKAGRVADETHDQVDLESTEDPVRHGKGEGTCQAQAVAGVE